MLPQLAFDIFQPSSESVDIYVVIFCSFLMMLAHFNKRIIHRMDIPAVWSALGSIVLSPVQTFDGSYGDGTVMEPVIN